MKHQPNSGIKVVGVITALSFAWLVLVAAATDTTYQCEAGTITAHAGDTLWGLADTHCTGSTYDAVYEIKKQTGATSLQIGDQITLP
jgi:hypothetical protein